MSNIQVILKEYLKSHTICEWCEKNESKAITRFGKIEAVCNDCYNRQLEMFNESTKVEPTGIICPGCTQPYLEQSARVDYCPKCGHSQGY